MSKGLKIDDKYLEELISLVSAKLVGKSMKRFEIFSGNLNAIKADVRELIYESFRDFKDLLIAHNVGLNVTTFKFVRPVKKDLTQKEE